MARPGVEPLPTLDPRYSEWINQAVNAGVITKEEAQYLPWAKVTDQGGETSYYYGGPAFGNERRDVQMNLNPAFGRLKRFADSQIAQKEYAKARADRPGRSATVLVPRSGGGNTTLTGGGGRETVVGSIIAPRPYGPR